MNGYPRNASGTPSMSNGSRLNTPHNIQQRPHSPGTPSTAGMSRAERFEDEKRRIIESCFSKLDQGGQLAESYITHIRIMEDAAHPSAPPPPDSSDATKKPRLIIIAVRNSGRVRMHKARENNNGSFSIGKTWNMEELSAIEVFSPTAAPPQSEKERQHREWAGTVGFIVTITKPYYWQAGTSKEKDFFIASAVKIYRKYTKGLVPELKGFDDRERAMILGNVPGQTQPPSAFQTAPPGARQPSHSPVPAPPQPPFAQRPQSREDSRYRQSPGPPPSMSDVRPGSGPSSRRPSESPARFNNSQTPNALLPGGPRAAASTEQMRSRSGDERDLHHPQPRPGTSPGPPGMRSGSFQSNQRAGAPPPLLPNRNGSPAMSPSGHPSALRPQSPPKQREMQPIDGTSEERKISTASSNGTKDGANLFAAARQRFMDYQPHRTPSPPPQTQLPPLDTESLPKVSQNGHIKTPVDVGPDTAKSDSSAGIDLNDAAAVGALTSYWGPEPTAATSASEEPSSPSTPQRSRHRPQVESKPSKSSIDLRPAPLNATKATPEPQAERAVPREVEEPAPLQVQNKSETQLPMPGAFSPALLRPSADSSPAETPDEEKEEDEQYRPGLGPMFKKRAIADRFKKAAHTANAFKPRPGGAAEKILQAKAQRDGEPDGITGVVPRPARQGLKQEEPPLTPVEDLSVKEFAREEPPALKVSSPQTPKQEIPPPAEPASIPEPEETMADEEPEEIQMPQPQVKVKRRSAQQERYLSSLGIDRSLLEGKGLDFENVISEFGWQNEILQPKSLAAMERDIRREHGRLEAGSWLSHADSAREERVSQVESLLDAAIEECNKLDGMLQVYSLHLGTLNDDIAYVEAQSQGLQVQSANQKLLQTELQSLIETVSLDRSVMEPIRYGDLADPRSLEDVETSLMRLYQAMLTMDPSISKAASSRPKSRGGYGDSETANIAALRDKKIKYDQEVGEFCERLLQFLEAKFGASMNSAKTRVLRVPNKGGLARLHGEAFTEVRNGLWMYSPLILFMKEVNLPAWQTSLRTYYTQAGLLYGEPFKENLANWRRTARASTGDETEILFTTQEKEDPSGNSAISTARKLTVKRSQTLAKTLRNASGGEKHQATEHKQPGAMMRAQAFAGAVNEMAPLISREQNFLVDLFHAHSLDNEELMELVQAAPPAARKAVSLSEKKPTDPDRKMAGLVNATMGEIFNFFARELDTLVNWSTSDDPVQGVGVLACLGRHAFFLQDSSQEYLLQIVKDLSDKLQHRFSRFVDEQVRAIEDTKVKIKKRKGVIAFMKIFPHFSAAVENVFASVATNDYDQMAECIMEVRTMVDDAYERINRAMFDSLKVIAKESPVAGVPANKQGHTGDDPEDKEMLNYHILLIENMNHYIEEVDDGGRPGVLAEWRGRAQLERAEALEGYVQRVIRRPLGKLLDFLESAESILDTNPSNPGAVSARPSYSRKAMRTMLSQHDSKEIRRGIDTLRKRIDKHFGEADEEALSRGLVNYVCKECERAYERVLERTEKLVKEVYPPTEGEKDVVIDFSRNDVAAGFRR
ncbi:hypothetical protein M409DRAFT_50678 [Zasmidium cellare ATCC 36951]|uniref:Exocyst complex component Sec3 PIP2-binding N-terminal domain-containing protein n=1 Tax=Zasmidium cellare ATCC 36951 TaxID=1080233 RepID=A0A6A6CYE1_ZASCE|nr:uncharacterized protein M409DRAFT_50678 [Zasmidium cellare ATCC 36951]KAF2171210.1 hypothetical protein M409DRAFT_50678 [Zasmidium cellare ATCC 36951]